MPLTAANELSPVLTCGALATGGRHDATRACLRSTCLFSILFCRSSIYTTAPGGRLSFRIFCLIPSDDDVMDGPEMFRVPLRDR